MINTITFVQLYIDCCEKYKIEGATPQGFINTLANELACTFLVDFALQSGYSEKSIGKYTEDIREEGFEMFLEEVLRSWEQLTGENYRKKNDVKIS